MNAPNKVEVVEIILKHYPQLIKDKDVLETKIENIIQLSKNQDSVYSANLEFIERIFNMLNYLFLIFDQNENLESELKLFRENTFEEDLIEFGFKLVNDNYWELRFNVGYNGSIIISDISVYCDGGIYEISHFLGGNETFDISVNVENIEQVRKFIKRIGKIYKSLNKILFIQIINEQN